MANSNDFGPLKGCVMPDSGFKIGDEVVYTNSYGVVFRNKTIVGTEIVDGEVRYFYAPTDAPWFSVKAKQLKKE